MTELDAKPPRSKWLWIVLLLALFVMVVGWYAMTLTNTHPGTDAAPTDQPSADPSDTDSSIPLVLPTTDG
jgi:flagellar basal body-associated protein FliL